MTDCVECGPKSTFDTPSKLPGVPVGRKVVPLVRVNGKITELLPGMKIGSEWLPESSGGGGGDFPATLVTYDAETDTYSPNVDDDPNTTVLSTAAAFTDIDSARKNAEFVERSGASSILISTEGVVTFANGKTLPKKYVHWVPVALDTASTAFDVIALQQLFVEVTSEYMVSGGSPTSATIKTTLVYPVAPGNLVATSLPGKNTSVRYTAILSVFLNAEAVNFPYGVQPPYTGTANIPQDVAEFLGNVQLLVAAQ